MSSDDSKAEARMKSESPIGNITRSSIDPLDLRPKFGFGDVGYYLLVEALSKAQRLHADINSAMEVDFRTREHRHRDIAPAAQVDSIGRRYVGELQSTKQI